MNFVDDRPHRYCHYTLSAGDILDEQRPLHREVKHQVNLSNSELVEEAKAGGEEGTLQWYAGGKDARTPTFIGLRRPGVSMNKWAFLF